MNRFILFLVFEILSVSFSYAASNSNPGFVTGQIPTAANWNSYFSNKLDYLPGTVNQIPYWDGSGNQLNAPVSGDCTATANAFTCALANSKAALFTAPPPIGSTTPNTGEFTTLTATTTIAGVSASQFGSKFTTTPSADTALAIASLGSAGGVIILPAGSYNWEASLSIPSNVTIKGQGIGITVLTAKTNLNASAFVNSNPTSGNTNIQLINFTYQGNHANQTSGAGVTFTLVSNSYLNIAVTDCYNTGETFSGGGNNIVGNLNSSSNNGQTAAGYGLYFYNSNDNQVNDGGTYSNNDIGIAVEASGTSATALRNKIGSIMARNNRAAFSQSGAGIHFEQSAGGDVSNGLIVGPTITNGTGVGINNTGGAGLTIVGGMIRDNALSGITTSAAPNIHYSGISLFNNGASEASGYQTNLRFDAAGLNPASTGTVDNLYGSGATEGLKTFSVYSSIRITSSNLTGTVNNYNLASATDSIQLLPSAQIADNGNSSITLVGGVNETTQTWGGAFTANATVTLQTAAGAYGKGWRFHIVRTTASTGNFNLAVGTGPLVNLLAGQYCDVEFNGSAWILVDFGSLTQSAALAGSSTQAFNVANASTASQAVALGQMPIVVTTASLGGAALLAGACASVTTTVTGATITMAVGTSPQTYPGDGTEWQSYVSAANTVITKVCAIIAVTPTASLYNLRVIQ